MGQVEEPIVDVDEPLTSACEALGVPAERFASPARDCETVTVRELVAVLGPVHCCCA